MLDTLQQGEQTVILTLYQASTWSKCTFPETMNNWLYIKTNKHDTHERLGQRQGNYEVFSK